VLDHGDDPTKSSAKLDWRAKIAQPVRRSDSIGVDWPSLANDGQCHP